MQGACIVVAEVSLMGVAFNGTWTDGAGILSALTNQRTACSTAPEFRDVHITVPGFSTAI